MSSTTEQQQSNLMDLAQQIFFYAEKSLSQKIIYEILYLLENQQPVYQNFRYLGHSDFALVLQSTKNKIEQVALKITKYCPQTEREKQKEDAIQNAISKSEYFIQAKQVFYLSEQDEQITLSQENHKNVVCKKYKVIEMQLFQSNLRQKLQNLRDSKIVLSDHEKGILCIQLIDSVNLLHQKSMFHKNIKPENVLVSDNQSEGRTFILKLSIPQFTSKLKDKNMKSLLCEELSTSNFMSSEIFQGKLRKECDLFSVGIILIELDNYDKFDSSKLSPIEIEQLQQDGIDALASHNIKEKSFIYQIAKALLDPKKKVRKSAIEILAMFKSGKEYQSIPLYSEITEDKVASLKINNYNNHCSINEQDDKTLSSKLSIDQIKKAVDYLYQQQKFTLLTLIGQGKYGVVFSAFNLEHCRESALKISLVTSKSSIMKQIELMSRCQSPYIVKLYSYQFFKDQSNIEYVVFEFEKCTSTLSHFLEQQTQDEELSQDTKTRLATQIIDSIALLHNQKVLHGDIRLENFLISQDEEGKEVIKLTGLDQSGGVTYPDLNFNDKKSKGNLLKQMNCLYLQGGSQVYFSPERYHHHKNPTTKLSDGFSAGICLLLLDNYLTFSSKSNSSYFQLLSPYEKPFYDCLKLFNLKSKIYEWALLLLSYNPQKRLFPQELIEKMVNSPTPLYSKWNNIVSLQKENFEDPCLFLREISSATEIEILNNQEITFSHLLSLQIAKVQRASHPALFSFLQTFGSLSLLHLNLEKSELVSIEVSNILKFLSKIFTLRSLEINLSINSIINEGIDNISQGLQALKSVSQLSLDLSSNGLANVGAGNLLNSLSKLSSLEYLNINLCQNSLGNEGEENLYQDLSSLTQLSSLHLDLHYTQFTSTGVGHLLSSISKILSLTSLEISLYSNSIGIEGEGYLFQDLSALASLQSLNLDFRSNQLTSIGVANLFKSISKLSSLASLDINLSSNLRDHEGDESIFQDLSILTTLTQLNLQLHYNQLTSSQVGSLLNNLQKLSFLQSLEFNLCSNVIESEGQENIYSDLSALTSLTQVNLNLESNHLTNIGLGHLLVSLSKLSSLAQLQINLQKNFLGSEGEENSFSCLSGLTSLSSLTLNLQNNQLTSMGVGNLFKSISNLSSLSYLHCNLCLNSIAFEGEENIHQDLSQLVSLSSVILNLSSNLLTSIGFGNLLKSFSKLTVLKSLEMNLCSNSIGEEGQENISSDLSVLTSLSILNMNLSKNSLTSTGVNNLLQSISTLSSLTSLNINLLLNSIISNEEEQQNIFKDLSALTSLSQLTLNLQNNVLSNIGANYLFKSISTISSSLTTLEINLCENSIGSQVEDNIYSDLSALTSLLSLNLNLSSNQQISTEVGNLLQSLSKLSSLSSLSIDLRENLLGDQGEENITTDLSALSSLQSINVNLENNQLTNIGVSNLLKSISKVSTLKFLEIHLYQNEIEQKQKIQSYFESEFSFLNLKVLNW